MRPEANAIVAAHVRRLAAQTPVARALAALGPPRAVELYVAARCPAGAPGAGKISGYGDPDCGREHVSPEDRIVVKRPTSEQRYALYQLRNRKKDHVTSLTGGPAEYRARLWNGWSLIAKRLPDGTYSLDVDRGAKQ